jgi:hypothetical protein
VCNGDCIYSSQDHRRATPQLLTSSRLLVESNQFIQICRTCVGNAKKEPRCILCSLLSRGSILFSVDAAFVNPQVNCGTFPGAFASSLCYNLSFIGKRSQLSGRLSVNLDLSVNVYPPRFLGLLYSKLTRGF